MPSESANNYYISHVFGGTGGPGGRGGQEGGDGGAGHGPSFQAETIVIQSDPEERQKIIEWASPLNFFPRQADIFSTRQPGTGEWFLQNDLFQKWRAGEIGALWCRGIPGAGKTVLASIVVDDLRRNMLSKTTGVAVLYLDHKAAAETHSATNLLAAVWQQLVLTKPVVSRVRELYEKHHTQGTRPSLEESYSMLHSGIQEFSCVFIVVDALDEYPEEARDPLLRHLCTLGPAVRLMFTSRPHINIDHTISNIETVDIRATENDIRKYVEAQINRSPRLSRHIHNSPSLQESIEEKIVKRSDGMFLLAKLHVGSLTSKHNIAAVRDALANLSSHLDNAYDDIITRINQQSEDDKRLAWRTLSWVVHAKRPLQPSRLKAALAVEVGAIDLNPERQTDMDIILSVCAGLVVIDQEDDKVRLIHYTTQIYFHSAHVQTSMFPHAQSEITLTCFTYMSLTFKAFPSLLRYEALLFTKNPFLHYTVEYCLVHAQGDPETDIPDSILSFLANCSIWWRLWNWKHGGRKSAPDKFQIAQAFQLDIISRHIIDEEDASGVLLQETVARGDTGGVQVLVQNGVDLKKNGDALLEAVIVNHEEIVRILLAHEGGNNSKCRTGAAQKCHGESVEPDGEATRLAYLCTALYLASYSGNHTIANLLVMHGADVNADSEEHGTALGAAVWMGHHRVVKLLIEHGADVNAKTGHTSLLQRALRNGKGIMARVLIQHSANLDAEDDTGEFGSLLQMACWRGQDAVTRLLTEHGSNVNAENGCHGSALHIAAEKGIEPIIQLLLQHGAEINAEGGEFGNPLQAALWQGHEGAARLLLQHGANVNAETGRHGTVLQAALWHKQEVVARLLVELGADVNAEAGRYGGALWIAVQNRLEGTVRLLLEHGADVNAGARDFCSLVRSTCSSLASTSSAPLALRTDLTTLRPNEHLAVSLPKQLWKLDSSASTCDDFYCRMPFHVLERRHHCRKCGGVFCQACSSRSTPLLATSNFALLPLPRNRPLIAFESPASPIVSARVCDECFDQIHGLRSPNISKTWQLRSST
ncbi:ANK-REP-REGION domain-containing protein [Mycena venus]|uniref:ANK-REP-REGION domain-containing protein n=1 Tax=Mycena venus TaxID=2733690 RepID=A0A8H6XSM5_9AGAR|nr:ANK-REP-REGION domain-containing protein [Mycena venus]